jgi:putative RNA 2'-phosphotransferase
MSKMGLIMLSTIDTSKFLSYILRHRPDSIKLTLDKNGWANIESLISCAIEHGNIISREEIDIAVAYNDKQRFVISDDGLSIRANQGHSIDVDLKLKAKKPPTILYHGTASRFIDAIKSKGLLPMNRQHVHLSANEAVAVSVGERHGKPVVLNINAGKMYEDGYEFYLSENGVWLTDKIPAKYISNLASYVVEVDYIVKT